MHDYLRPMAVNVPVTMFMSMFVSFTITPWLAYYALKGRYEKGPVSGGRAPSRHEPAEVAQTRLYRLFRPIMEPLLTNRILSVGFLFIIFLAFVASLSLVATRRVQPKQLPFDNKDELLLVVDMPEGTPLERTNAAARDFEDYLRTVPEATERRSLRRNPFAGRF